MLYKLILFRASLLICFALFLLSVAFSQNQFNLSVKGKLTRNKFKVIYFDRYESNPVILDSAAIINNAFEIKTKINETAFYALRLADDKTMVLVLSPGDNVELSADAANFQNPLNIKGSKDAVMIFDFSNNLNIFDLKKDSLNRVYEKFRDSDFKDSIVEGLRAAFERFTAMQNQLVKDFILNNPASLGGLLFINRLDMNDNIHLYVKYDSVLFNNYPNISFVKDFHNQVSKNIYLSVGQMAPDIIEKDTNGRTVALSSLRGKVVLIDFWASWCGPCRRESPHMVRLYNDFKSKGFEIFGVSLDKDMNSWKNAIKKDKLAWTHVSDLGFWHSKPAQLYNVNSIPFTVIIDRNGKIIAKGLFGQDVETRLSAFFSSESSR